MWIPKEVQSWFVSMKNAAETNAALNIDAMNHLLQELAATRAERDALKLQNAITQANFDWVKTRVNALEVERAALLQKAYGVQVPVPEIVRMSRPGKEILEMNSSLFEDMGDDTAKELGLPVYGN